MAEMVIRQADIDSLGQKLEDLSEQLSDAEKALLVAMFGLARTALDAGSEMAEVSGFGMSDGVTVSQPRGMPSVSSAFGGAFSAGGSSGMAAARPIHGEGGISGGSGGITGNIKIVF